ncbi:tetratricopeptide repeat protein [Phormidium sp. LEGE 05292]|uniref:TPR domain-containing glycosyltransferase n=1 Tax=[Phormidium] sp. LEGE 05292 TaxID=767427 RepID=UPI00187F7920|nr:TPR domain-containing glycosyltransferase [Phormidium sp. LEGE 05292]MBE9226753.1 tetratricopeptide repeat protein [Phormidium sp. LEGE 05292]
MKLSLCTIAKNESQSLPKCLESVQNVVDEIIVLDTGSTDKTPEIAQNFGAKVYHLQWCNDFSVSRNEALKYVQCDWVLVLDADEVLKPEIVPQLKQVIQQTNLLVVNLVRQEIDAKQTPYSLVSRLFRKHPEVYFSRPYHAMIDDSVSLLLQKEPQWQIGSLSDVAILHYGYEPGAIASRNKFQTAKTTMEGYLNQHPNDPYVCNKLGALYLEIGETAKGIELLQRGLTANSIDAGILYELHYHLGIAYESLQQLNFAESHYQTATQLDILPQLKLGAFINLGNVLKATNQLAAAQEAYVSAIAIDQNFAVGYYNLGMLLKQVGRFTDAIALYQQAIKLNPNYAEAYQNLGVVFLKVGNVAESLVAFKRAIELHQTNNPSEAARLRQGLKEMGLGDL